MRMNRFAAGTALICLMLCAGCTSAPPVPMPVIVYNACPRVSLCPMPGSDPTTNGDLSADIRQLVSALEGCALQVRTVKNCQDKIDVQAKESAKSLN
ncbi:TPA: Rz1-like lysis system protein LysC [Klebsiella pneumoniae]